MEKVRIKVRLDELNISEEYQRPLNMDFVNKKVKEFDPSLVNDLHVSCRNDGNLYIIDGQHTAKILEIKYGKNHKTYAFVYQGISKEEEAELFYKINSGRRQPKYNEILKSKLEAGMPEVKEYFSLLDGLIDYSFSTNGYKFDAHQSGMYSFKKYGREAFVKAIKTIANCSTEIHTGVLLKGLARFYFNHPDAKEEITKSILDKYDYSDIRKLATVYTKGSNSKNESGWEKALVDFYNKGRSKGRIK